MDRVEMIGTREYREDKGVGCLEYGQGRAGAGDGGVTKVQAGTAGGELHGGHVVEGVVQLLADGLVLQFLGIQLIYWWAGVRGGGEVKRVRGRRQGGVHMERGEGSIGKTGNREWRYTAQEDRGRWDRMGKGKKGGGKSLHQKKE